MIFEALSCVTEEINAYFRSKLKINEEKIILSGIVNQDGTLAVQGENKVLVTLVNVEKDTIGKGNAGGTATKTFAHVSPGMNINLYVLFSAYFGSTNYGEALRFLSFIIAYFQHKNVFNKSNTPGLEDRVGKLIFEMESLGPEKLNNVWTTLGAKYIPSVMYKVRMLTFDDAIVREFRPAVAGVSNGS